MIFWRNVIRNSGQENLLLWRQPEEDFNANSTLIVEPGEAAIFVHNGKIEKVFEEGTYRLTTENYPVIRRLRDAFAGGVTPYGCGVFFVRKAHTREMRWGITPAIQVRDPRHGILCKIRTNGAYRISISDPSKFLMYMVGNRKTTFELQEIDDYFGNEFQANIRTLITQFINNSRAEIVGICEYQLELAHLIEPYLAHALSQYGIDLESFSIASMDIMDDDPNRETLERAYAQHASLKILGEEWARIEAARIMETLAQNPGAGGIAGAGAGVGMGLVAAPVFANLAQQMFNYADVTIPPAPDPRPPFDDDFEPAPADSSMNNFEKKMQQLQYMRDNAMITEEVYTEKIQEILNRM